MKRDARIKFSSSLLDLKVTTRYLYYAPHKILSGVKDSRLNAKMYTYNFFSLVFLCFLVTKNWKITGMNKPLKCYGFLQLDYFFQESYFECFHPQVSMTLHLLLLFLLFPAAFTQTDVYSIIFGVIGIPDHIFLCLGLNG